MITDKTQYRYFKYISDINGQDIQAHGNKIPASVRLVSDWLRNSSKRKTIPGGAEIARRYKLFSNELPEMCKVSKIKQTELGFNDYAEFVSEWIRQNKTA